MDVLLRFPRQTPVNIKTHRLMNSCWPKLLFFTSEEPAKPLEASSKPTGEHLILKKNRFILGGPFNAATYILQSHSVPLRRSYQSLQGHTATRVDHSHYCHMWGFPGS